MQLITQYQTTNSVVMVRPHDFGYNEQTGKDNEFQHKPGQIKPEEVTLAALNEFSAMESRLSDHHIEVIVLEKNHTRQKLPDAIFPNNWFSTRSDGKLFIYPMKTPNRQAEVQVEQLVSKFTETGYNVNEVVDLRQQLPQGSILEGTGCLIFHHPTAHLFVAHSERCEPQPLASFSQSYGYQLMPFETVSQHGSAVYHTNVLMSCGEDFAVIAQQVLADAQQSQDVMQALTNTVGDVIVISEEQMSEYFCGNIIQLKDKQNQPCIVMSTSAHKGFNAEQLKILEKHGSLIVCDVTTIEHIGGGGARCMIAENFLPRSLTGNGSCSGR